MLKFLKNFLHPKPKNILGSLSQWHCVPKYCQKCGSELKRGYRIDSYNTLTGEVSAYGFDAFCPNYHRLHRPNHSVVTFYMTKDEVENDERYKRQLAEL